MNNVLTVTVPCPNCQNKLTIDMYRKVLVKSGVGIGVEQIFDDSMNMISCSNCSFNKRANNAIFYHNIDKFFGVFYEPIPNKDIDGIIAEFNKPSGPFPNLFTYLETAPRVNDWETFKKMIQKYESGELKNEAKEPNVEVLFNQKQTVIKEPDIIGTIMIIVFVVVLSYMLYVALGT